MLKIAIAADHAGFELKNLVAASLRNNGYEVIDEGCHAVDSVDYPDYAKEVAKHVASGKVGRGILVCGTGVGMAVTANKVKGVRAAALTDVFSTKMARQHNDLNVLCLGSRVIGQGLADLLVDTFLKTEFEGGRHKRRVEKIEN